MPARELRLLSLDGGGVRGLSSLYILRNLMEKVEPGATTLPKPCDYFDMIGGTSTGGLIAIMLGRLEMSVDECIEAYTSLSEEIFSKESRSRFRFSLRGDLKSRFDARRLETAIMKILKKVGMDQEALLSSPNSKCKVFVCAASQKNETLTLRSYTSPRDNRRLGYVKIWEACRATSAAQGFFDPIEIPPGKGSELFTDGGIRANNPVKELWAQACDLWATDTATSQDAQLRQQLKCLVSIGTGRPDLATYSTSLKGVVKVLSKIATDTEAVAESFAREKPELFRDSQYFRFNVDRGLKGIGLDECDRLSEITSATSAYIETQVVYSSLKTCASVMGTNHTFSGPSQVPMRSPTEAQAPIQGPSKVLMRSPNEVQIPIQGPSQVLMRSPNEVQTPIQGPSQVLMRSPNEVQTPIQGPSQVLMRSSNKAQAPIQGPSQGTTQLPLRPKESSASAPVTHSTSTIKSEYHIPFKLDGVIRTDNFVPRPEDTERIEDVLLEDASEQCRIFVLHGMGGIGKTQLAINFAYKHKDKFDSVFWLQGQTEDALRQSFAKCAKRIPKGHISEKCRRANPTTPDDQQEIVDEVMEWLAREDNFRWLLVIDNIDLDPTSAEDRKRGAFKVTDYIPGDQGSILITSRLGNLAQIGSRRSTKEVSTVSYNVSKLIFEKWYEHSLDDDDFTKALLGPQRLSGLPLAVAQAAVYVKQNRGITIEEYIRRFDSMWPQVIGHRDDRPLYNYHGAVGVTWALSVEQVREKSEEAVNLIKLWAFLDNRNFSFDLFYDVPDFLEALETVTEEPKPLVPWLRRICRDEGLFNRCLQLLHSYRLANIDIPRNEAHQQQHYVQYSMHPLVHRWAMYIQTPEQQGEFLVYALHVFGDRHGVSRQGRMKSAEVEARMKPHVRKLLSWVTPEMDSVVCKDGTSLKSLRSAARFLDYYGNDAPLVNAIFWRILRNGHTYDVPAELRFDTLLDLGSRLRRGNPDEAEPLILEAQTLAVDLFGGDGFKSQSILDDIATLKFNTKDYDGAEQTWNQLIGMVVKGSFWYYFSHVGLAKIRRRQGQLDAAISYAKEALHPTREHPTGNDGEGSDNDSDSDLGDGSEGNPGPAEIELGLASVMKMISSSPSLDPDFAAATRDALIDAFAICTETYSLIDFYTCTSGNLLAFTYILSDQLQEAEELLEKILSREDNTFAYVVDPSLEVLSYTYAQRGDDARADNVNQKLPPAKRKDGEEVLQNARAEGVASNYWDETLRETWAEVYKALLGD